MWLNRGRFRDNGNCGYLLRPPFHQPGLEDTLAARRLAAEESAEFSLLTRRQAKKLERQAAKAARRQAKQDAKAAKQQANADARVAKRATQQALVDARAARKDAAAAARADLDARLGPRRAALGALRPAQAPLTAEELEHQAEIDAILKIEAAAAAEAAAEAESAAAAAQAAADEAAENSEEDEVDDESEDDEEGEDSDGNPDDAATDDEGSDGERWHPPTSVQTYVATSKWATEAATYTVRVLSASHLPKSSASTNSSGSSGASGGGGASSSSSIFSAAAAEDDGNASLEVELHGAPCDCRKWPPSSEVSNDGVKHVFDEAVAVEVAEPRLALLRFTVLRQGVPCAQTVVPCHLMRPGVRWVQLYDPLSYSDKVTSDYLLTRLLVLVHKEPLGSKAKGGHPSSRFGQLGAALGAKAKEAALKLKHKDMHRSRGQ
jgi:chemotaxis protein histidine kinase CheA